MKTISNTWFNNSRGSIGVVLAENEFHQMAYISAVPGNDEEGDITTVKEWGAKMTIDQARGFFGDLVNEETYG